jgi:hypothetical protein
VCEDEVESLCVSGNDNDKDALPTARIEALPEAGQLVPTGASTPLTEADLPYVLTSASLSAGAPAGSIGCITYLPPAGEFGRALESFVYTVNDGALDSPALFVPLDVYPTYAPPAVVSAQYNGQADSPLAITLAIDDQFSTPNRTYKTAIKTFPDPSKGKLLNNDFTEIAADTNGQFFLKDPFNLLFVPNFNTYGSPLTSFTVEVIDVNLIGVTQSQYQVITFGNDLELGRCTIYRPTTGNVAMSVGVGAINHPPTLTTTNFVGFQNERLSLDLEFVDVDGDTISVYVTGLPAHGSLYVQAPAPTPASCGAVPDVNSAPALTAVTALDAPIPTAGGKLTLYYYPALDGFGADFDEITVKAFDRPAAEAAGSLDAYLPLSVSIDIANTNQPPLVFYGDAVVSGRAEPLVITTTKNGNSFNKKLTALAVTDVDLNGGEMLLTISATGGQFVNLPAAFTANANILVFNPSDVSPAAGRFRCRLQNCNAFLSSLVVSSTKAVTVTVTADDMGNSGAVNPRCPSGVTTATFVVQGEAANSNAAAIGGGAAAGVAIAAVGGSILAVAGWIGLHRSNVLDEAAVPFEDDGLASGTVESSAYTPGSLTGASPIHMPVDAIGGARP